MASDNQSSNSISASKEIIRRILQAKNPKNFSEISDRDLQSSDTKNMIRHGELYTDLLDVYVDDIRQTLENKRKLKEQFYGVCESILTFTCAIFFVVIFDAHRSCACLTCLSINWNLRIFLDRIYRGSSYDSEISVQYR